MELPTIGLHFLHFPFKSDATLNLSKKFLKKLEAANEFFKTPTATRLFSPLTHFFINLEVVNFKN